MTEPIVSIQNANIYQGGNLILQNVNFEVHKGEFVYLVGKTGTGKTEMIRMIAKHMNKKLVIINAWATGNSYEDSDFINLKESILPLIQSGEEYIIAVEQFEQLRIKSLDWLYGVLDSKNIIFIFHEKNKKVGNN